jgi:sigma-E factor negative regulatory protein RseA
MRENINEKLSAFMDGELDGHHHNEIIDVLTLNPDMRQVWWRYHLIADAVTQDMKTYAGTDLASSISAKILQEPTTLSPLRKNNPVSFIKPLAGMAIAASVAAVAILGFRLSGTQQQESVQLPRVVARDEASTATVSQFTPAGRNTPIPSNNIRLANAVPNARMNSYLLNHNEYNTMGNRMQGIIPYVRIIANDPEQQ